MSARLHWERVAHGAGTPTRAFVLTHGIYGAGMNWRGIARKLVARLPDWVVVLVDLRQHGRSEPGDPPHTLAACAADVVALLGTLRTEVAETVAAIGGHSFGGKVMMQARDELADAALRTVVLDSSPSPRHEPVASNDAMQVLAMMESLPTAWATREDFVTAVIAAGKSPSLAQWLAMNVEAEADGSYRLRLDLAVLRALLTDYFERDLWASVLDPARGPFAVLVADRGDTLDAADRERLAAAPPHVHVHHLDAGHWLHVDAPEAVVEVLVSELG